jgi:hypothetical protein
VLLGLLDVVAHAIEQFLVLDVRIVESLLGAFELPDLCRSDIIVLLLYQDSHLQVVQIFQGDRHASVVLYLSEVVNGQLQVFTRKHDIIQFAVVLVGSVAIKPAHQVVGQR